MKAHYTLPELRGSLIGVDLFLDSLQRRKTGNVPDLQLLFLCYYHSPLLFGNLEMSHVGFTYLFGLVAMVFFCNGHVSPGSEIPRHHVHYEL